MVTYNSPTYPTFATQLLTARRTLTLADHIGLALRAHRHHLRQSQRAYAARRHWTQTHVARLETTADTQRLADILQALHGTGYTLALVTTPSSTAPTTIITPTHWPTPELIARVRGGRRRFPAHHTTHRTSTAPQWWLHNESTHSLNPPHWTTTPPHLDFTTPPDPDSGPPVDPPGPAPSPAVPADTPPSRPRQPDAAGQGGVEIAHPSSTNALSTQEASGPEPSNGCSSSGNASSSTISGTAGSLRDHRLADKGARPFCSPETHQRSSPDRRALTPDATTLSPSQRRPGTGRSRTAGRSGRHPSFHPGSLRPQVRSGLGSGNGT